MPRARSRREFLALGGGAVAAALLAACGSNTGRGGGSGTLVQWYHQYGEAGTQQAVKRYASKYDDADVDVVWTTGDYDRKAAAALLKDGGPDVLELANGPTIDQIRAKQVVPLTGILGDTESDFTKQIIARMSYEGELYAVPETIDMQLLFYRKSLLEKAGVQPPATVPELVEAAKALTTKQVKGLFAGNDGGVTVLGGPALWAAGLDYLDADNEIGFDDPAAATSLAALHTMFANESLLLGAPSDWSDPSAIQQGLCAMQWSGLWNVPVLQKALGDDLGVAPYPALSSSVGAPSVPIGAYGSGVNAKSKQVDAAKKYVKWLWVDNTADQLDFAQSYGFHIPARRSLAPRAKGLQSGIGKDAADFVAKYAKAQTPLLWTPKSMTAYQDAVSRIIKDGANPSSELKSVIGTAKAELKRIGK
ncbi:ABC transporter substrate-binding protein [Jatrophihabitans fulvus]